MLKREEAPSQVDFSRLTLPGDECNPVNSQSHLESRIFLDGKKKV